MARKKKKKKQDKEAPQKRSKGIIALVILLLLGGLALAATYVIPEILFPDDVRVPDIVGLHEMEALRTLRDVQLDLAVEQRIFDNEVPAGHIVSQDPLPGRMVKEGREILVRVSRGPEEVEMPSFIGLSLREAKVALTQAGFVEGENEEVYDPAVGPGIVLEQRPEPGEIVVKGYPVSLVLSKRRNPSPCRISGVKTLIWSSSSWPAWGCPWGTAGPSSAPSTPRGG